MKSLIRVILIFCWDLFLLGMMSKFIPPEYFIIGSIIIVILMIIGNNFLHKIFS
jgi:hypothetical protein